MCLPCRRPQFNSWVRKIRWRKDRLPTPVFLGFPCGSAGKEFTCNVGDLGSIPGLGRSPGEGKGYPLQYSGLENCMDCIVDGVAKSQTQLSNFHFHFKFHKESLNLTISVFLNLCSFLTSQDTYYLCCSFGTDVSGTIHLSCPVWCSPATCGYRSLER